MPAESIIVSYPSSNMKFLVVLAVAVACASADVSHLPQLSGEAAAPILKSSYEQIPGGPFEYYIETGNGIFSQVKGDIKNVNSEYPALEVAGTYRYTAPDGTPVETSYVADENGFRAEGSHIPTSPPIPAAIVRSLQYIAENTRPEGVVKPANPAAYLG